MPKLSKVKDTDGMASKAKPPSPSNKRKASEEPDHAAHKSKNSRMTASTEELSTIKPPTAKSAKKTVPPNKSAKARKNGSAGTKATRSTETAEVAMKSQATKNTRDVETPAEPKKAAKVQRTGTSVAQPTNEAREPIEGQSQTDAGTQDTTTESATAKAQKTPVKSRKPAAKPPKTTNGAKKTPAKQTAEVDGFRPKLDGRILAKNPEDDCYHGAVVAAVHEDGEKLTYDIIFDKTDFTLSGFPADCVAKPYQLPAQPDEGVSYTSKLNDIVLAEDINGKLDYLPARVVRKAEDGRLHVEFEHRSRSFVILQPHQTYRMYEGGPMRRLKSKVPFWPTANAQKLWVNVQAQASSPTAGKRVPEAELDRERLKPPHTRASKEGGYTECVGGWTDITVTSELKRGHGKNAVIYAQIHQKDLREPRDINGELDASSENSNIIATWKAHQGGRTINIYRDSVDCILWQRNKANKAVYISFVATNQRPTIFVMSAPNKTAGEAAQKIGRAVLKKWLL
ncbi:hypothetical protein LTR36_010186 [Oleoguttula mirabilis]|uniref:Uncharacterized protein n=1 Tax=Oleoguttula mirabilis TaxID=1507867 RepID=A0AAV9JTE9_9PEZI|nr:hypothetical protein LTR36_010186 [Oleoguttula mirabilis]